MRYRAEHKQETRQRVLAEAARAIRAQGVLKVGVAEVMARAGLTHGGFYAHFASREDFIGAAIDQMFAEGAERLAKSVRDKTPADGLADYIDFYLSAPHRDTRVAGCPLPFLSADAPRLAAPARARVAAGMQALTLKLAKLLEATGRVDAEGGAASLLSEMVGAVCLARVEPDIDRAQAILTKTRQALVARLCLQVSA